MTFDTIIGLEVHAELKTNTKIFCGCSTSFGAPPNTQTCPVCLGYPGVLPVLNKRAVDFAIKASLATNCSITEHTKFDRKNYFYPDNPKAYQISQFDQPLGQNGSIEIEVDGQKKSIGITRIHIEEDAGKLTHDEEEDVSLVDFNRAGTPLIEIVSEPDLRTPEEAYAYLEKLKAILQYTEVSDCKMEEGSLRCDANISLRPSGQEEFGTKTELKNLNSFANVQKGLAFEEKRQEQELRKGNELLQETRRWNDERKETVLMRVKEGSDDYRYFPEPDLVNLFVDKEWQGRIQKEIPELPDERRERYISKWEIPAYDAGVLTQSKASADFFEETVAAGADAKQAANWMMGEVNAHLNANHLELEDVAMTPSGLAELIHLIEKGTISSKIAKKVFKTLIEEGGSPEQIVEDEGLVQISDESELKAIVEGILEENPKSIEDYKNGKDKAFGFLVGQTMKATKGKANPQVVNKLIKDGIDAR